MRIAFFGTPSFAVPTLEALLASRHDVGLVVTQPDRPRGRGHRVTVGPVKALALAHGVPVLQPERLTRDPWEALLGQYDVELGVVAAYGKILPAWLLEMPARGLVNVHASLLPRYRGASPIHRAVMNGDPETGVTIMRVVQALDAGPILAAASAPIGPDERADEVEAGLSTRGAALLVGVVDRLAEGPVEETAQDETLVTYAPRLTKEDGRVDWTRPARAIHNQIRGLAPWPHAFTMGPHGRLILHRSRVESDAAHVAEPGTILGSPGGDGIRVATGEGILQLLAVQAEGGKVLPAPDFLAGHALPPGQKLRSS